MENNSSWVNEILPVTLQRTIFSINSSILFGLSLSALPTNILNMLAFRKLGLNTSINISFFSLSLADFTCACVYVMIGLIMFNMNGLIDIGMDVSEMQFILAVVFVPVSALGSWITALISVERCVCVVSPFKVKQICTAKFSTALIATMLVVQLGNMATCYASITVKFNASSPDSARPRVFMDNSESNLRLLIAVLFWGSSLPTLVCFVVIVLSTAFLAASLRRRGTWLQSLPVAPCSEAITFNRKLIGTVIAISVIYITCFVPGVVLGILYTFFPALDPFNSDHKEFAFTIGSIVMLFQAASATVNIFMYCKMNSRYRAYLKGLLCAPCAPARSQVWHT